LTDFTWLLALLWLVLFVLSWMTEHQVVPAFGGILGIIFGLHLMSETTETLFDVVSLVIIGMSLYQIYYAIFTLGGKKK
jgi:uncharacterized membrane protein YqgA involved in biofilm formation